MGREGIAKLIFVGSLRHVGRESKGGPAVFAYFDDLRVLPACEVLGGSTWLTFRRTYSSWSHDLGVPDKVTAELMGHTKVDTTVSVYTQTLTDAHAAAAARIGDELFADCSQSGVRGYAEAGLTH